MNMLSESYRVLKPNGYIRIAMPNFNFLIQLYLNKDSIINSSYIKWAAENFCQNANIITKETSTLSVYVINNFFRDWNHQIIHDFNTIKNLLEIVGFIDVTQEKIGSSSVKEFKNIERHGNKIPVEFNELETFVVQAKKV